MLRIRGSPIPRTYSVDFDNLFSDFPLLGLLPNIAILRPLARCGATSLAPIASGPLCVHEIKFDGYRMAARIERGKVQLLTPSGLDWTAK
jgi:ATP-dependent DNA ligase